MSSQKGYSGIALTIVLASWASLTPMLQLERECWKLRVSGVFIAPRGGDIEVDAHTAKRMRRSSSDALQDMVGGDELSLYGSAANNTESAQVLSSTM
ncbi:cleavage and polyadenylation specificity factor subunit 1 isoform X3 [Cucumis melo var. makuwa]|uniref:Cleavage and polyadenylation specificity factor subunit 1 isoform X3 n=1 Tax=Cucumis melo var. makuwa TaxID=1194695 RepID=A0A5D3CBA0_CUCMM|nr:cleavage and polyadenylation specificity factor subunit 1 isoform X3 [Cucumis melo var. makuwa]